MKVDETKSCQGKEEEDVGDELQAGRSETL